MLKILAKSCGFIKNSVFTTRFLSTKYSKLEQKVFFIWNLYKNKDIDYFKKTISSANNMIYGDESELKKYNEEYRKKYKGNSQCVLRPNNVQELSKIMKYCNERLLPIVPQGGRTSLVVGALPMNNEIVISLEKMNKIHELSPYTGILKTQAGAILADVDKFVNERGYIFPLDLGARVFSRRFIMKNRDPVKLEEICQQMRGDFIMWNMAP